MAKVIDQSENPKGPKGRFHMLNPLCHSIFSHTKDQKAAKDFLRWLMAPHAARPLATTSRSPTTSRSCTPTTTRRCGRSSRATCHTATRSRPRICRAGRRRSAGRSRRAWRSSSIVDMFAKACAGKSTKEVIADAQAQLKQIYRADVSG